MKFCTAVNCMDGRIQSAVISYLQKRFNRPFVDMITEPGPNKILAEQTNSVLIDSILSRLNISVKNHQSRHIAVVGHYDCAGNPAPKEIQLEHIKQSVEFLSKKYPETQVIGLWVNEHWQVEELPQST